MKKFIVFLITFFIGLNTCFAISVPSNNAILIDQDSGRILFSKNINEKHLIASTTKIMTAVLAIESGKLDDMVTINESILKSHGSGIYIKEGEKISLRNLVYGLLLRSGNDASVVIAKEVGGSEEKFVEMMNEKAKDIGMKNTIFKNPHGLDEETKNFSTAYDMALLSKYAFSNKLYRKIVKTQKYEVSTVKKTYLWYNRNQLLTDYKYCTGGKNGYTPSAGKTLVSTASKDDLNLTIVSLNDGDIYNNHENLYENIFSEYHRYEIIDKNDFHISAETSDKNFYLKLYEPYKKDLAKKRRLNILDKIVTYSVFILN